MLRLIYRTFVALDIYCGSRGPWTSCKRHRSIQCQQPEAPLPRRHHKPIHAKIIHFHWTPSMREQEEWRLRRWRQWHEERSREKGRQRRGEGSGRWVSTSTEHPEVNASPISPSLIVGCAHTNITNHYQSSIWSCKCSLGLRRIEMPPSCGRRGMLAHGYGTWKPRSWPGGISSVEIKTAFRAKITGKPARFHPSLICLHWQTWKRGWWTRGEPVFLL